MRRAPDALWRAGDQFLVLGRSGGDVITVSGPGVDVWLLLEGAASLDDLAADLAERYGADEALVRRDVGALVEQLREQGFVVDD